MNKTVDFYDIAMPNIDRGLSVLPLWPGNKNPLIRNWPELITRDRTVVAVWAAQWPTANCGAAADVDTCILESDNRPELERLLGYKIPECYTVQARTNRPHFYFCQTDATRALGNRDLPGIFEFKQSRKYVVAEGSLSPYGPIYTLLLDRPRYPMPDKLVADITALLPAVAKSEPSGAPHPAAVEKFVRRFTAYCDALNVETAVRTLPSGKVLISTSPCLLWDDHDGGVGITPDGVRCVQCFHSRCSIGWARWARAVEEKHGPMRLEGEIRWTK
jgi:hypothetical protein